MPTTALTRLLLIIVALAAIAAGAYTFQQINQPSQQPTTYNRVPVFTLSNHFGKQITEQSLEGQWTLLFLGYTFCPDVCPTTLSLLNQLHQQLPAEQPLNVLLVSVDPDRDSPERLNEYIRFFNDDFAAATGTRSQIDQLTGSLYLPYRIGEPDSNGVYLVDHAGALTLIGPDLQVYKYFNPPHSVTDLTEQISAIRDAANG